MSPSFVARKQIAATLPAKRNQFGLEHPLLCGLPLRPTLVEATAFQIHAESFSIPLFC
jgi:hypothetical protein